MWIFSTDLSEVRTDKLEFVGGKGMYEGAIIEETLTDELLLDYLIIDKVEIWKTNDKIKYWTMVFFHSDTETLPELISNALIDGWFAAMKNDKNTKFIIFKGVVLQYTIGNKEEKESVLNYMRTAGIPEEQFNWSE